MNQKEMQEQSFREQQILLLQDNLSSIRKIAGWSTETLAEKIGVTKQTISNLERKKTPMNFTQYIAIRSILDYEIEENPTNEVLGKTISILLDNGYRFSKEEYSKIKEAIDTVAASAFGGTTAIPLTTAFTGLVLPLLGDNLAKKVLGQAITKSSSWLKKIFNR